MIKILIENFNSAFNYIGFNWPKRHGAPLFTSVQMVIVGIIIVIGVLLIYGMISSMISDIQPKEIIQDVVIESSESGICIINTSDRIVPQKIIQNCNLEVGKKVTVNFNEGMTFAKIILE